MLSQLFHQISEWIFLQGLFLHKILGKVHHVGLFVCLCVSLDCPSTLSFSCFLVDPFACCFVYNFNILVQSTL